MTSAREFFCAARDAVQRITTYDQRVEAKRQLALRASRVLDGYALVDRRGASIVRMRYLRLMPWAAITEETGLPYDMVRSSESVAFDRIDSEGISAMAGGTLRTTGAE